MLGSNAVNQQVNFHQTSSEDLEDPAPLRNHQPMGGSFFRSWICVFVSLKLLRATILEKLLESDIISPETPLWLKWSVPSDMYDFIYSFEG